MTQTQLIETETSFYGAVFYERGLEIAEIGGFIELGPVFLKVYGDPDLPVDQQRHTAVPVARVIEIDYSPLAGPVPQI